MDVRRVVSQWECGLTAVVLIGILVLGACGLDSDEPATIGWIAQEAVTSELHPLPGGRFSCPARRMPYCRLDSGLCRQCARSEDENPNHFDCDDYALVCMYWMHLNGVDGCHVDISGAKNPFEWTCKGCQQRFIDTFYSHAINSALKDKTHSCLYEPQDNRELCCWEGKPGDIPQRCLDAACRDGGALPGQDCRSREVICNDLRPQSNAGERPFYVHPEACSALERHCGLRWQGTEAKGKSEQAQSRAGDR
jgi:hypothetical protein